MTRTAESSASPAGRIPARPALPSGSSTELTRRGYRISTIKHAHHDFDIDKVGADSYRHRAGRRP